MMPNAAVSFLLVEPDPAQARRIEQEFQGAKIANPLVVVPSASAAACHLQHEAADAARRIDVVLVGPGSSPAEQARVLEALRNTLELTLPVLAVCPIPNSDELRIAPWPADSHPGVPVPHVAELLEHLALVIITQG